MQAPAINPPILNLMPDLSAYLAELTDEARRILWSHFDGSMTPAETQEARKQLHKRMKEAERLVREQRTMLRQSKASEQWRPTL